MSADCHTALSSYCAWIAALAVLVLATAGAHAQTSFGPQPVGAVSGATTVNVTLPSGGTVSSVEVLTLGVPGTTNPLLDFQAGSGFTCVSSINLAAHASCQQSVTFDPTAPGLRIGAVVLFDSGGDVLGTAHIYGTGVGGLGVLVPGNMAPVAGDGLYLGSIDDGRAATQAELYWPTSQVLDAAGNLYIADSLHNRLRMVCAGSSAATSQTIKGTYANCTAAGVIVTIAGNGNASYSAAPGPASAATLNDPSGLAIDGAGNLYIADTGNGVIRMISAVTGDISTIAGSNPAAVCGTPSDTVGDGCLATAATFSSPEGITLDGAGNLYIADTNDHRIRMVSASTGDISTIAGNGTITDPSTGAGGYTGNNGKAVAAELNYPYTVAFDPSGNMYIPDSGNNVVREVAAIGGVITTNSIITTFAGTSVQGYAGNSGLATHAELDSPLGVAVDAAANVYIADSGNNAIRKVNGSTDIITSLVVNKTDTAYVDGNIVQNALFGPSGLYLDGAGNLYVADSANMIVRQVQGNYAVLDYRTPAVRQFSQSAVIKDQTVENDGNAPLDGVTITHDANAAFDETGITDACPNPGSLPVNADCAIGPVFSPQVAANPLAANIYVAGNTQDGPPPVTAPGSPLDIQIIGNATAVNSTTVAVNSNIEPSGFGQNVILTATVSTGSGTGDLTGTVTFLNNGVAISAATNLPMGTTTTSGTSESATATFPTSTLPVGANSITATYVVTGTPGDLAHTTSTSLPYIQNVDEATKTTLTTSGSPSNIGQNVTFTATVSIFGGGGVTPDGTVTFYADGNAIGSQSINGSGVAQVQDAALTLGDHNIYAQYSGGIINPSVGQSTSTTVPQDVQGASSVVVASGTPNPSNYGVTVTFTATVTPAGSTPATGAVKFYDGTQLLGTSNLVTGTNQTTITYSGLPVGTDNITAQYAGDVNNAPSTTAAPYPQQVNKTQTTTTVLATPQPNGIAGGSVSITATVQIVAGNATLGGTVTFTNGVTALGAPVSVNSSTGKATLTLNNVAPATYSIIATYSGDTNDDTSTSAPAYPYTVVQATTQTAVTFTPNPALIGQTVTFTAKVTGNGGTPGGSVTFEANGTVIGTPATLDGTGTATLTYSGLAADAYTITAIYSGDPDDLTSTGIGLSQLNVGTITTVTDLASASTTGANPQVVLVAAVLNSEQVTGGTTPTPTGPVTFKNGATVIGSSTLDTNGVATLPLNLPTGNYTITAVYGGDLSHTGSTSQPISVSTTATSFNISVAPGSVTMATKQNYTVNVNLSSVGGFNDTIGLGCASLPPGVTCHFNPLTVALAANGTATAQLTIDTNNPLSGGAQAMNAPPGTRRTVLAGVFVPFALFFGWIFWSFRRRNRRFLTLVLVLALSAAALLATGCGGFSESDATPGTYTIQVTGTGINSGVIHYQTVTLIIT